MAFLLWRNGSLPENQSCPKPCFLSSYALFTKINSNVILCSRKVKNHSLLPSTSARARVLKPVTIETIVQFSSKEASLPHNNSICRIPTISNFEVNFSCLILFRLKIYIFSENLYALLILETKPILYNYLVFNY